MYPLIKAWPNWVFKARLKEVLLFTYSWRSWMACPVLWWFWREIMLPLVSNSLQKGITVILCSSHSSKQIVMCLVLCRESLYNYMHYNIRSLFSFSLCSSALQMYHGPVNTLSKLLPKIIAPSNLKQVWLFIKIEVRFDIYNVNLIRHLTGHALILSWQKACQYFLIENILC